MARNMITGKETQKMQEYTQERIAQAERRDIEFPTDVKERIVEYANLIGEEEKVRTLIRNLEDAITQADEEGVEDLLDDASMDIQELPDPTIGKLELRDYGYEVPDLMFGKILYVELLAVLPEYQKRKIGINLLNKLRIDAENAGYKEITLRTGCYMNAYEIYKKYGFKDTKTDRRYMSLMLK